MLTNKRVRELDAMRIDENSIRKLTNEELVYLYEQLEDYDDVIVPEMVKRSGIQWYLRMDADYDMIIDDVIYILNGKYPHCWIDEDGHTNEGYPAWVLYRWGGTYDKYGDVDHSEDTIWFSERYSDWALEQDDSEQVWNREIIPTIRRKGLDFACINGIDDMIIWRLPMRKEESSWERIDKLNNVSNMILGIITEDAGTTRMESEELQESYRCLLGKINNLIDEEKDYLDSLKQNEKVLK